jgi:hypothetical protein
MKTIVGIDYSLTCPCICVANNSSLDDIYFHFLHDNKKFHGLTPIYSAVTPQMGSMSIMGDEHDDYLCDQQRYENIASWVLSVVSTYPKDEVVVLIEDYAFAAKGRVFNLAENCGIMKYLLYKGGYDYHTIAPSVIKKHATGKGNANKQAMYDAFLELTGVDLIGIYGGKNRKLDSPVTDIVDSFYLAHYMVTNIDAKSGDKIDRGTNRPRKVDKGM